jgi:hypothetical protein
VPNGEEQPCALRALTLCDGQVAETPERGLTMCLCREERIHEDAGQTLAARCARVEREALVAYTTPSRTA